MIFKNLQELLTVVAWMYYVEGKNQREISEILGISRVKVSRLLSKARESGIVKITITRQLPEIYKIAVELKKRYGLSYIVISPSTKELPDFGANFIINFITNHRPCRFGMGWSRTLSMMVPYLLDKKGKIKPCVECSVHDLAGSYVGHRNPYSISWIVADLFEARYFPLPIPVFVDNPEILRDKSISQSLKAAEGVDIALVGMGTVDENSTLLKLHLVREDMIDFLRENGAIGEILMRFFDENGSPLKTPFDDRVASISWKDIEKIPIVVMAYGDAKIKPLKAALRGNWLNGIITDLETARSLLL